MSVLVTAEKWGVPPWEVVGRPPDRWTRLVWLHRQELYMAELGKKMRRDEEAMKLKRMSSGKRY